MVGCADFDSAVHLVEEDPEKRVAKLVSSVGVKQPCEDVGYLPFVPAITHHVEYVEVLLPLLGKYWKKPCHELLTHSAIRTHTDHLQPLLNDRDHPRSIPGDVRYRLAIKPSSQCESPLRGGHFIRAGVQSRLRVISNAPSIRLGPTP
jgi:hypothetical protein